MNERQRADQLARAIDELISGAPGPEPARFDDQELQSLIQVAQARLGAGNNAARTSAGHEAAVWQQLIARPEERPQPSQAKRGHDIATDADMLQTVAARREMSAAILSLAARHKDEVWGRVQERIKGRREPPGQPPSPSGGSSRESGGLPATRTRFFPTGDAGMDSLLAVALNRPTLRDLSAHTFDSSQRKLHERRRGDPARRWRADLALPQAESRTNWAPLAAAGAIILLIIAALGPVPGLAHPPAVEAARYIGQHLGVIETEATPPTPGPATTVLPEDVTPQQASDRLGLPVAAPDTLLGLAQSSSRFFSAGLTSDGSGVFVITYEAPDGSSAVSLYQEAASGDASLAVPAGKPVDASIGGIGATYFEGGWAQSGVALRWLDSGTQTLLFERGGLRTTVQYTGPQIDMDTLTAAATMLVAPPS
jgi:hypothetical protein